jgi:ribosome-associated translation inhibitor RaiA
MSQDRFSQVVLKLLRHPLPALSRHKQRRRKMQIQVNTDDNIEGREKLAAHVRNVVENNLSRFNKRITRVEVHLSDQNGDKNGWDNKRCMMEARLQGRQPTAVTHQAATIDQAVDGAAERLQRALERELGRERARGQGGRGSHAAAGESIE